jgi:hypothetical protein
MKNIIIDRARIGAAAKPIQVPVSLTPCFSKVGQPFRDLQRFQPFPFSLSYLCSLIQSMQSIPPKISRPFPSIKNLFAQRFSLRCSALFAFSAVKSRPIPNPALSFFNIFRPFSPVPNTF